MKMGYPEETYQKAHAILAQRREKAESENALRKAKCAQKFPEIEEINMKLGQIGISIAKVFLEEKNKVQAIEELKVKSLALQEEKAKILEQAGLPRDYLKVHYHCEECSDTGIVGSKYCKCYYELLKEVEKSRIKRIAPIDKCTFESFDVKCYTEEKASNGISPRMLADSVLCGCIKYCAQFSLSSPSLLLMGSTGLGKTHLALAIANAVIDRGFGVVFGNAQNILSDLESIRFGRNAFNEYNEQMLMEANLLIIDDLGAEFITQFTVSCIYNIVNSRMLAGKPTIITTNLNTSDLEREYGQRLTSRLTSEYTILRFIGNDIRYKKKDKN